MSSLFQVSRPCYATRQEVMRATDIKLTPRDAWRADRAIQAASENIDGRLHRQFYFEDKTVYFDWPNYQYAYPWRLWLDQAELADVTDNPPVLTTGGQVISNANVFYGHPNYSPPYTYVELNRATTAAFGVSTTPQRDTSIRGTFGYWTKTDPAGTLSSGINNSVTALTVTNGTVPGVGDMIVIDSERMIVQDKTLSSTGQTQQDAGCSTTSASDNTLAVTDGTTFSTDEIILLNSERMLIVDISGNSLVVKRAYDGSVLATHTSSPVNAYRSLTVARGALGTAAASHSGNAVISRNRVPAQVRSLAIAEASIMIQQEIGAYASKQGEEGTSGGGKIGSGVGDLWDEVITAYGRKARQRVI